MKSKLFFLTIITLPFIFKGQAILGNAFYKNSREPFPLLAVELLDHDNKQVLKSCKTDLEGAFRFDSLQAGTYFIRTQDELYGDSLVPVTLSKSNITLHIIILQKGCQYNSSFQDKTCPVCHQKDKVLPIVYGLIVEKKPRKKTKRNYIPGGCVISLCDPNWYCERDNLRF